MISGYLIAGSWLRSESATDYFARRALRIFPGLWACFIWTGISIAIVHGFPGAGMGDLASWFLANVAGFSYTPFFLKAYGTGSINGSLWTIPVELQFYIVLPFLMVFLKRDPVRWLIAFVTGLAMAMLYLFWLRGTATGMYGGVLGRLLLPWLYMFMLGVILQWWRELVVRWLAGRFVWWLLGYLIWIAVLDRMGVRTVGNTATPLSLIPLAALVVAAAFTNPNLAYRILGGHDLSYGLYLYHMPVLSVVVALEFSSHVALLLNAVTMTALILAGMSWWLVERPALRLKLKRSAAAAAS